MANISTGSDRLGRFGHCQDPANDFCIEVEVIEDMAYDVCIGLAEFEPIELDRRILSAMEFRVGGDEIAMQAKLRLRQIKDRVKSDSRTSKDDDAHEKLALYGEACRAYALTPNLASLAVMVEAFDAALAEMTSMAPDAALSGRDGAGEVTDREARAVLSAYDPNVGPTAVRLERMRHALTIGRAIATDVASR